MGRDPGLAMKKGFGFVCANCDQFWRGVEAGVDLARWRCAAVVAQKPCGGPLAGMSFPEYQGPLKERLEHHCFVCGAESFALVDVRAARTPEAVRQRMVGVCEKHTEMLGTYSRPGQPPARVTKRTLPLIGADHA
jgi:hypothetical protein